MRACLDLGGRSLSECCRQATRHSLRARPLIQRQAVAFGNKTLYKAKVNFYGLEQHLAEDDGAPMSAGLKFDEPPFLEEGRSALAPFIPLIACRLLHNSKAEPAITGPMMWVLREAANEVLEGEAEARAFSFHGSEWRERKLYLDEFEEMFIRSIPRLRPATEESPDQTFRAELMRKRGDGLWAKIHAPKKGPAFFAAYGLLALIEHSARNAPFTEAVEPALVGVLALTDLYFDVLDQENWDSLEALMAFQAMVNHMSLAGDPKQALTEARIESGIEGISGPPPWE